MAKRARLCAVFGFVAAGAAVLAVSAGVEARPSPMGRTLTVHVQARYPWTATPVTLKLGQVLLIRSTGAVIWQPNQPRVGPDGRRFVNYICARSQYSGRQFAAPGINCWALIGRIGPVDVPFYVGSSFRLKSPSGGRLYLGFNDDNYSDNSGSFKVTIKTR